MSPDLKPNYTIVCVFFGLQFCNSAAIYVH